jgi:hypothetical protein
LIERLKKESSADEGLYVATRRLPGICYTASEIAIKNASMDFDKIIVVVDADGPTNRDTVFEKVNVHIHEEIKGKVDVIIMDYELEEWICYSLGIHFGGDKPSNALNDWCKNKRGTKRGYKKRQLPNFVEDLDFNALRNCFSFRDFVNAVIYQ